MNNRITNTKKERKRSIVPIYSQHRNISIDRRWGKGDNIKEDIYISETIRVTEYVNQVPAKDRIKQIYNLSPEESNHMRMLNKIQRVNNSIMEVIMATGCTRLANMKPVRYHGLRKNDVKC